MQGITRSDRELLDAQALVGELVPEGSVFAFLAEHRHELFPGSFIADLHACVRCPMLRISLSQVPRLLEIEANTHERLDEARRMRWLGEVAALEESLRHIANKKQQAERLRERAATGEVGVDALG